MVAEWVEHCWTSGLALADSTL